MTLAQLITTKQQAAREEFDASFDLDDYGASTIVQDKVNAFIRSKIYDTAHSVLDAVKELVPEEESRFGNPGRPFFGTTSARSHARSYNACRTELLSRLERFSSNDN